MKIQILNSVIAVAATAALAQDQNLPHISRQLLHGTVRIETPERFGTGFFFQFNLGEPNKSDRIPCIVTAWHVVEGSADGTLYFGQKGTNQFGRINPRFTVNISTNYAHYRDLKQTLLVANFESIWIRHPDTNVDLAVVPLKQFLAPLNSVGVNLDFVPFNETSVPNKVALEDLPAYCDIRFSGYPIGVWDEIHNLPVTRKGIAASDPVVDYNGNPVFLIDAAVYPGSSGSPVYYVQEDFSFGGPPPRGRANVYLLGVLARVSIYNVEGKVDVINIPTSSVELKARTGIPSGMGHVIKSEKIMDFLPVLKKRSGL